MEAYVTKAHRSDIPTLNQISVASKAHWGYPKEWIEKWMDDLLLKESDFLNHLVCKIELGSQIIGFSVMTEHTEEYEILHLWVLPEFIGRGFGKKLLTETIDRVVEKPKAILVEADPNAEAFYASQGFITFNQIESYPKGRFLPVMRKEIV
jgi:ribosomal protein S18 acetylase RimI-like enzyme